MKVSKDSVYSVIQEGESEDPLFSLEIIIFIPADSSGELRPDLIRKKDFLGEELNPTWGYTKSPDGSHRYRMFEISGSDYELAYDLACKTAEALMLKLESILKEPESLEVDYILHSHFKV